MSALDEYISKGHHYSCRAYGRKNDPKYPCNCGFENAAAELAQLRTRNAELEEYHGFHMGIIPEGEPTVEEERLRAELAEAMKVMNNCLRQVMRLLQYHP